MTRRILGNQLSDLMEFLVAKITAAIADAQEVSRIAGDKRVGGGRASSSRRAWSIDQGNQGRDIGGGLATVLGTGGEIGREPMVGVDAP